MTSLALWLLARVPFTGDRSDHEAHLWQQYTICGYHRMSSVASGLLGGGKFEFSVLWANRDGQDLLKCMCAALAGLLGLQCLLRCSGPGLSIQRNLLLPGQLCLQALRSAEALSELQMSDRFCRSSQRPEQCCGNRELGTRHSSPLACRYMLHSSCCNLCVSSGSLTPGTAACVTC